jgi:hypothetical protein
MQWEQSAIYCECMAVIRRWSDAYDYAMGRADQTTAHQMIYELQPVAGWYALAGIDVSDVLTQTVDPEFGVWEDFPEAAALADEAADIIAQDWDSSDSDACRFAVERFEELAAERGITLRPRLRQAG